MKQLMTFSILLGLFFQSNLKGSELKIETIYSPIPFIHELEDEVCTVPLSVYLKYDRAVVDLPLLEYRQTFTSAADMVLFTLLDAFDQVDIDTLLEIGKFPPHQTRLNLLQSINLAKEAYERIGGIWQMRILTILYQGNRIVYVLGIPKDRQSAEIDQLRVFRFDKENDRYCWDSGSSADSLGAILTHLLYIQYTPHLVDGVENPRDYAPQSEISTEYEICLTVAENHEVYLAFNGKKYGTDASKSIGKILDAASEMPLLRYCIMCSGHREFLTEFMSSYREKKSYLEWLKQEDFSTISQQLDEYAFKGIQPQAYFVIEADPFYIVFTEGAGGKFTNNPTIVLYEPIAKKFQFINTTFFEPFYKIVSPQSFREVLRNLKISNEQSVSLNR